MNELQTVITVGVLALSVWLTRWLPFVIFRDSDKLPKTVEYLGRVLPAAAMGFLVVYCFKDYDFSSAAACLPALIAGLATALLHRLKKNMILSITAGTALYMLLIRIF